MTVEPARNGVVPTPASEGSREPTGSSPLHEKAAALVQNICRVVKGHDWSVEMLCAAALAGGHVLLEDLPGTGKTTMARAFARSVGGDFQRVQGTADLLPSDITGSNIWDQTHAAFTFVQGPVFCNVLLVDEINRTPPRTQSAFLEVMEEGAVTIDGARHDVPAPFFLMATQNPAEHYGTYPLPESQLDRFAAKVRLGSIDAADEIQVVRDQLIAATVDDLDAVVRIDELADMRLAVRQVHIADSLMEYIVGLIRATRDDNRLGFGASPRAAIILARMAQAHAVIGGRDYVGPSDVKAVAVPVLAHRVNVVGSGIPPETVIADVVDRTPIPIYT